MISDLTYKVVALPEFPELNPDDSIDWATEMIALGYNTPAMYMLASFSKPSDYWEIISYIKLALKESGIECKSGDDAFLSYAFYHVHQIVNRNNVRKQLSELMALYMLKQDKGLLYDFYLLSHAWNETEYLITYNNYWEDVTAENIEQTVVKVAKKWLQQNTVTPITYEPQR